MCGCIRWTPDFPTSPIVHRWGEELTSMQCLSQVSEHSAKVHAKGLRQDEALDLDMALPLLPPAASALSAPNGLVPPGAADDVASPGRGPSMLAVRSSALSMAVNMNTAGSQLDVKVSLQWQRTHYWGYT